MKTFPPSLVGGYWLKRLNAYVTGGVFERREKKNIQLSSEREREGGGGGGGSIFDFLLPQTQTQTALKTLGQSSSSFSSLFGKN